MLSYNKVTLYGGALVDYLWIKNTVDDQPTINSTTGYYYTPSWDGNTLLLAPFTENINGGNIVSLSDSVVAWQIYRTTPDSPALQFIARVPAFQSQILDFGVTNNNQYSYTIFAETENYLSAPMPQQGYTQTNWDTWSLIGLEETDTEGLYYTTNDIWIFNSNLSSSSIQSNLDKYTFEPFTQYPKISTGKRNYVTGNITALLGNVNPFTGAYENDSAESMQDFQNFIASENFKLLRDRKGNGWICATTSTNIDISDESIEQIASVNFDFTQINGIENFSIIGA